MAAFPIAPGAPREVDLPVWGGPAERLRFLLGYAVLAPSRHNAQPWIFEIEGDEARLYADPGRSLAVADPRDREKLMGCGAALLNLRLAAAHFGFVTSVEVVAGSRRDGMLARLRLEERRPPGTDDEELFRAIPVRRTCRLPLDGRDLPAGLVARIAAGSGQLFQDVGQRREPHRVAGIALQVDLLAQPLVSHEVPHRTAQVLRHAGDDGVALWMNGAGIERVSAIADA